MTIRRCENPDCPNGPDNHTSADISHLKSTARFCGSTCRAEVCRVRNPDKYAPAPVVPLTGALSPKQALCLKLLRDAGSEGVTTSDFLRAGCGSRFGGRLHELREAGFAIEAERERQGSHRYTLISEPAGKGPDPVDMRSTTAVSVGASSPSTGPANFGAPGGQLFEIPKAAPRDAALADPE